jgi:hypothetical protein
MQMDPNSQSNLISEEIALINKKLDLILAALEIELATERETRKAVHRWLRGLKKVKRADERLNNPHHEETPIIEDDDLS